MSFCYQVYGLQLCANRPILGLLSTPVRAHNGFKVWLGVTPPSGEGAATAGARPFKYVSHQHGADGAPTWTLQQLVDEIFRLTYIDRTEFTIDLAGRSIWATWPNSLTLEDTVTYLVGPVLGFVLRCLGTVCLHASAIAIDGHAILLTGLPGAGKSTTAAAFAALGFPVLSDDIAALSFYRGQAYVQPGYPRVNLWADSASALFGAAPMLPLLTPTWDKHFLDLTAGGKQFQSQPLALAGIYILGDRSDDARAPFIEAMPGRERVVALIGNTYANNLLDAQQRAEEFARVGELVSNLPVRRVVSHMDFRRLPRLCEAIIDDLRGTDRPCNLSTAIAP